MKKNIHPNYSQVLIICSCGNIVKTCSTLCRDISIDVCSKCHPFYTGKQRVADTKGRIEKFNKKFKINVKT
ncbi:MAG: 50S ribosomal protein L31 [Buchnera aphidicola (Nurudea shiraii)]